MSPAICPDCGKHDTVFVGRYRMVCRSCENGGTRVSPPPSVPPFSRPVDNRP